MKFLLRGAFAVEVLPESLVALEAGELVQLERFAVLEVLGDEFYFARFIIRSAAAEVYDGKKGPVDLMDASFQFGPESDFASVWVGSLDKVFHLAEKVGTVA